MKRLWLIAFLLFAFVSLHCSKAADVDRAVQSAQSAFPEWSEKGPSEKRAILNACADALEARAEEFVQIGIAETGSTEVWYRTNVKVAASMLREAAAMTTQIKGEIIPANKPGTLSMGYRQPVGVLVGVAPWNAPIILGVRSFAMPLACGNTVVMKASEKCPGLNLLSFLYDNTPLLEMGEINEFRRARFDHSVISEGVIPIASADRIVCIAIMDLADGAVSGRENGLSP